MVSHLRKMSPLSRDNAEGTRWRQQMSPLIPLFTGMVVNQVSLTARMAGFPIIATPPYPA